MTVVTMLLLSIALLSAVSGFAPAKGPCTIAKWSHPSVSRLQRFVKAGGDFPPEEEAEEYTGEVDWDAEWKKVVASDGKLKSGQDRPGKDFYKSEAEIAAIKAANRATEKALEAGSSIRNSVPDMGSLTSDWKFWIGILVVISVGLSLLTAPSDMTTPISGGDSYYI